MLSKIIGRLGNLPKGRGWRGVGVLVVAGLCVAAGCGRGEAEVNTSDEAFRAGWASYGLGDYHKAVYWFEMSSRLATNEAERVRGKYALADTWNFRSPGKNEKRAGELYREVVATDPTGAWAPWAALTLVRQDQIKAIDELPDLKTLEKGYTGVMEAYPGHEAADEAFLFLQTARMLRGDAEELGKAVRALEEWVNVRTNSLYLSNGYSQLAQGYLLQSQGRKYINALVTGVNLALRQAQNVNLPLGDQAGNYFKIAMAAQMDAGDFELARMYYEKLMEEYPTDQRVFVAEQHLAKMEAFKEAVRRELSQAQAEEGE